MSKVCIDIRGGRYHVYIYPPHTMTEYITTIVEYVLYEISLYMEDKGLITKNFYYHLN